MGTIELLISIAAAGVVASNADNVSKITLYMFVAWYAPASLLLYAALARSFSGETKKVTVNAIFQVGYAIGNIAGAQTFRAKDAPEFTPAKISMVTLIAVSCVSYVALFLLHAQLNRKRNREFGKPDPSTHHAIDDLSNQTDWEKRAFFRYPL